MNFPRENFDFPTINLPDGIRSTSRGQDGSPISIEVSSRSHFFFEENNQYLRNLLSYSFSVHIFRRPIELNSYIPFVSTRHGADFIASSSMLIDAGHFSFHIPDQSLAIRGFKEFPRDLWTTSGRITSAVDLYGSQILFIPNLYRDESTIEIITQLGFNLEESRTINAIIEKSHPKNISIMLANGRTIRIPGHLLHRVTLAHGGIGFTITLPRTREAVNALELAD